MKVVTNTVVTVDGKIATFRQDHVSIGSATDKRYMSYSGWKGGEKYTSVAQLRAKHPEMLIMSAVKGIIPKNRLGRVLLTKLKVYKGNQHPHAAQQPAPLKITA